MENIHFCFLCNGTIEEYDVNCVELYWHQGQAGQGAVLFLSLCEDCFDSNKDNKQKNVNQLDSYCCYCNKEVVFKEHCMYFSSRKEIQENQMYPFMHRQCFEDNVALFPEGYKTLLEEQLEWTIKTIEELKKGQPQQLIVGPSIKAAYDELFGMK